ncbi:FLO/LFY-like protein [Artemisia annua]|uniref:Floricaula/leafy-like transcription factor n=1 Tax=Artemisia annua TaxID=35608 RepID=A0A2U1NMQ6_ARTAN|nr:FLO/LFY-like protein [Artemisia annua]
MGVWVSNHKKEWVPHCRMDDLPNQWLDVLGCLNKDGDILGKVVIDLKDHFFVYSMQSGSVHEANIAGRENENETAGDKSSVNKLKLRHYVHCYALHCLDEEGSNALRKAYKERGENVGAWRQACYKPIGDYRG